LKSLNCIEPMFSRLKQLLRVTTLYDKARKSFSAFHSLVAANIWLLYNYKSQKPKAKSQKPKAKSQKSNAEQVGISHTTDNSIADK